jgi:hypothetical protein
LRLDAALSESSESAISDIEAFDSEAAQISRVARQGSECACDRDLAAIELQTGASVRLAAIFEIPPNASDTWDLRIPGFGSSTMSQSRRAAWVSFIVAVALIVGPGHTVFTGASDTENVAVKPRAERDTVQRESPSVRGTGEPIQGRCTPGARVRLDGARQRRPRERRLRSSSRPSPSREEGLRTPTTSVRALRL